MKIDNRRGFFKTMIPHCAVVGHGLEMIRIRCGCETTCDGPAKPVLHGLALR